jgi:hypothetical protein
MRFTIKRWQLASLLVVAAGLVAAGCGGSSAPSTTASAGAAGASSASPSEAASAATGDIPDNQVFLTFHDRAAGYSIKYPEGWAQSGNGNDVTFQDKANIVHATVAAGPPPTTSSVSAELAKLKSSDPSVQAGTPQQVTINGAPVIKATYTKESRPDPVTGKRLPLTIDRYEYAKAGKVATLDLGTPKGVDNVDAYRLISESFRWQ